VSPQPSRACCCYVAALRNSDPTSWGPHELVRGGWRRRGLAPATARVGTPKSAAPWVGTAPLAHGWALAA
jgi:hypothetical protein